ncbi:PcsB-like coiled-coil domain-containing protein [Ornithinibacillus halophilus]|uniref:3D (Asp-Asp-Asp) domain-containing protein n=1 Tax=Ornithinibacillus halophilus TaxID=930117 RepID=A0A1M5IHP4_9BACI|nr:3D domain-containing protein [Ornithinibacillus halophilus]SHG27313.1 3D (Asp-Asp-Asp) domain-containing protein [Ornithinibacillus halophilus]
MGKKITVITLATLLVIGCPIFYSYADTKDLDEIKDQRKEIKTEQTQVKAQINEVLTEIDELCLKLESVNESIEENERLIEKTEENITETVEDIRVLQEEIEELEENIESRYEILEDRVVSYQRNGGSIGFLEVVLGSESFGDLITRIVSLNKIAESDVSLMDQLQADKDQVAENQQSAFDKLDNLNQMRTEQEETLELVTKQKQQLVQNTKALERKQNELNDIMDRLQAEDSKLASVEAQVKREIEIARQKAIEAKKREEERKAREKEKAKLVNSDKENESSLETKNAETLMMTSTAYTANCTGCRGITYTGINLKENPDAKVIAVDPSVIPLGSVVHVEGYGYAIAGDIGSAIKGNKIDVFVPTKKEAYQWGVRRVKVTIQ